MSADERFLSGFCRAGDMMRRVLCEYEDTPGGERLVSMSCGHDSCEFAASCELARLAERCGEA